MAKPHVGTPPAMRTARAISPKPDMRTPHKRRSIAAVAATIVSMSCVAQDETSQPDSSAAVAERLESGMKKAFAADAIGDTGISDLRSLALVLTSSKGASAEERLRNTSLLAEFLGQVRASRIPGFQRLRVVANVAPPKGGGGPVWAGMNPAAITDAVARAQYEEAIQRNQENNLLNIRQRELETTDRVTSKYIIRYLADTFAGADPQLPAVVECIEKAKLSDKEKEEVIARMISK